MTETITIPIQLNHYEELFNELDRRPLNTRKVNEDVDTFIKDCIFNLDINGNPEIQLILYLPATVQDHLKETLATEGLIQHYKSFSAYEARVRKIGARRLIYYIVSSLILSIFYYLIELKYGVSFVSTIISTAATVILWQASSLIFIESKNFKINIRIHEILTHLKVKYVYE